ncbi:hypothetical protein FQN51_006359 [Onygenales sp. PD_10]|nr:hypothetical protein FQN51_006359 [Onygenales sp. PD_10]
MDPFTPKAGYGQDISNSILGTCHIIRLDENRVLKKGHENAQEPATMQFIAENTTIPVPKIYTTKSSSKKNATDFVMDQFDGPFDTENGFNDFQAKGADQRPGDSNVIQFPGDNHAIHFAHGDLSPRNVMVDEGGHIIGLLDWEWAGWFPEYWEVVRMRLDLPSKKQMPQYAELLCNALPNTYDSEFSAMVRLQPSGPGGVPVHPKPALN